MTFTRTEEVAILIVSTLAETSLVMSVRDISQKHSIPVPFLKKIMRLLKMADIVRAKEGISGGYQLSRSPSNITLNHIVRAVCTEKNSSNMITKSGECPLIKYCLPHTIRATVWHAVIDSFSTITIASILSQRSKT